MENKVTHLYVAACAGDGGIYHYTLQDGQLTLRQQLCVDRPMYLELQGGTLRALLLSPFADTAESGLITVPLDDDGALGTPSAPVSTHGLEACHLCTRTGVTYVANYSSGSVFSTAGGFVTRTGHGPDTDRQEMSHPHCVLPTPDGRYLVGTDLGLDTVFVYDPQLHEVDHAKTPAGHGPRHLVFTADGRLLLCVNELASTVTVFRYRDGTLTALDTVSALPTPDRNSYAAAIRLAGDRVLISHRGQDCITCQRLVGETLTPVYTVPCGGHWPRDFLVAGGLLFCANERSDTVSVLRPEGDGLTDTGLRLELPHPLCIAARSV